MKITPVWFRRSALFATVFASALFVAGCATAVNEPAIDPALTNPETNTALKPATQNGAGWLRRHEGFLEIAKKGGIDVLFLGDSITDFWQRDNPNQGGKAVWEKNYGAMRAANFGISADRTQHVLWRMEHGELDGISPKVVVLMIGTNNTGMERGQPPKPRNTPAEATEGVKAIVRSLRQKLPDTKILLLAIFPRGEKPDALERPQIAEINRALARLDDGGKHILFLDIGQKFLAADGTLPKDIMPDFLHPNVRGYEIWADAIREPLARLMK